MRPKSWSLSLSLFVSFLLCHNLSHTLSLSLYLSLSLFLSLFSSLSLSLSPTASPSTFLSLSVRLSPFLPIFVVFSSSHTNLATYHSLQMGIWFQIVLHDRATTRSWGSRCGPLFFVKEIVTKTEADSASNRERYLFTSEF